MAGVAAGDIVAIPAGDAICLGKVVFLSSYFADVTLLKLLPMRFTSTDAALPARFDGAFDLVYASIAPIRKGRWKIIGREEVSAEERALSRRTSGGEVWIEDRHLGPASETDLASLPKMLVVGDKLVEKRLGQMSTT